MITASSLVNETLTIIINNGEKILTTKSDNPRWQEIIQAYKHNDKDRLEKLISLKSIIDEYSRGKLSVNSAGVTYDGRPMHTVDSDRVMAFLKNNLPYQPIANYIERKAKNPSKRAIEEMYDFLEHRSMPLTDDGMFIAYRGVQSNYWSKTGNLATVVLQGKVNEKGQILNEIGATIEVERSSVDDRPENDCAPGLHIGSLEYAKEWGPKVILVEVDPADVVSVPKDCNCSKMRCCKYKVIGEYIAPLNDVYTDEFNKNTTIPNKSEYGTISEEFLDKAEQDDVENDVCCFACGHSTEHCICNNDANKEELSKVIVKSSVETPNSLLFIPSIWNRFKYIYKEQIYGDLGLADDISLISKIHTQNIDSLDVVDLVMAIEEVFGIEFLDDDAYENKELTFADIVDYIIRAIVKTKIGGNNVHFINGFVKGAVDKDCNNPSIYLIDDVDGADGGDHIQYINGYVNGYNLKV